METFVIAEIGQNHNGDLEIAKKLIREAKWCGANAVKFQIRDVDNLIHPRLGNKPYDGGNSFGKTYYEHRKFLEFSKEDHRKLRYLSHSLGLQWGLSVWDEEALFTTVDDLEPDFLKIPSAEATNLEFIRECCDRVNDNLIVSTGMCNPRNIGEIYKMLIDYGPEQSSILHCVSSYPLNPEDMKLNTICSMCEIFPKVKIGYSSHERGYEMCLVACAYGAEIIEKHFTLDRTMKGSDHAGSLEPKWFKDMVRDIRIFERAGGIRTDVIPSEMIAEEKLKRSPVANRIIEVGEMITHKDVRYMSCNMGDINVVLPFESTLHYDEGEIILRNS